MSNGNWIRVNAERPCPKVFLIFKRFGDMASVLSMGFPAVTGRLNWVGGTAVDVQRALDAEPPKRLLVVRREACRGR